MRMRILQLELELLRMYYLDSSVVEDASITTWPLDASFPFPPGHSDYQPNAPSFPGILRPEYSPSSAQHRQRSREEPIREQASRVIPAEVLISNLAAARGIKRQRDEFEPDHEGHQRHRRQFQYDVEVERQAGNPSAPVNWPENGR